jgi:hypothetical protein
LIALLFSFSLVAFAENEVAKTALDETKEARKMRNEHLPNPAMQLAPAS